MADQRTLEAVHTAEAHATLMRATFILLGLLLAFLLWKSQRNLRATLGGSVNELHTRIAHLGSVVAEIFICHLSRRRPLVAQKLLDVIAVPCQIEQYDLNVTGSIGIALYPGDGANLEAFSKSADSAMYRAKHEGRHGYRFFIAEMQIRSMRHLKLVNALRQAIECDQLQIYYQPQVSVRDGSIVGAEALLHWTHPVLGSVSPVEFIPSAEESGLILPIGEWVLRHAARQANPGCRMA